MSVILVFLLVFSVSSLDFWRLRLVDFNATTKNFLIRGPWPGGSIAEEVAFIEYTEWKEFMKLLIHRESGIKIDDMYIIDISLLHSTGIDGKKVKIEENYFEKNPDRGEFFHWEINGTHENATNLSPEERDKFFENMTTWDVDQIVSRIPKVHNMVHSFSGKNVPTVIYWHCEGGVDRTGEMSGAYLMKYFSWTFKKAFDYDVKVKEGKPIGEGNSKMMNWYCFYMEKFEGKSGLDCGTW